MGGPLAGVKIIELATVVLGPFASLALADLGADVIKIESLEGDTTRYIGPRRSEAMASSYLALNRNKRSIALDLRQRDGVEALMRLITDADVLLTNIRPASLARLGVSYATVSAVNEQIIYCGAYGFGESGRYAGKPAFDDLIQGAIGIPHLVEQVAGARCYLPTNLCDRVTALTAAYSVLAALYARERTGRGQAIEVPMLETMTQFMFSDHLTGYTFDPPLGPVGYSRLLIKGRGPFKTKDGFICALVYLDKHLQKFCDIVGRPEIATDERFATITNRARNIDVLNSFVAEHVATRTTAEWLEAFAEFDIPAMPMHTLESLIDDPHLRDVEFFSIVDHPSEGRIRSLAIPTKFSDTPAAHHRHAPLLGEHTREILQEAGYTDSEIQRLLETGAARDFQVEASQQGEVSK